ncbi:MAG: ArsR/SmtB family transcription factor [Bryobacteraceae bacterium]
MPQSRFQLSDRMVELIARRFRILGEPQRLRILQVLQSGEHTVSEIVEVLEANQSNISRHLQALYDSGLVGRRKAGNSVYYSIADPMIFELCHLVCRRAAAEARETLEGFAGATPAAERGKR